MNRTLRIALAEDEPVVLESFRKEITSLGHEVVIAVRSGAALVRQCRTLRPDLVVTDVKMPDMDGITAIREICRDGPVPIIIVSAFAESDLIARAEAEHVFAYLVKPIDPAQLNATILVAMSRFAEYQVLRQETDDLRQVLKERKLIERAKGLMMKKAKVDESTASARLKKLATEQNRKLVEVAEMIILAEDVFDK